MKRIFIVVALALSLGACADVQRAYDVVSGATVSPESVYIARNAFAAAEATATNYITLCKSRPKTPGCRKTVIAQLVPAIRSGRVARENLKTFAKNNPGALGPSGLYNALTSATSTINQIATIYNIGVVK